MKEWFSTFNDALWLKPYCTGAQEAAFIKKVLRLRKGQKVLDVPCGTGRIAIHLARAGCALTAIDLRVSFIRVAKARFRKEHLKGSFVAKDMRTLDYDAEFHGICNWDGSFGYFSDEENLDFLRRCAGALRPNGRLLVEQANRECALRHFQRKTVTGDVTIFMKWDSRTQRVNATWVLREEGKQQKSSLSIRLYTPGQMTRLFERAGLDVEAIYGGWRGEDYRGTGAFVASEPYKRSAKRMIVVGRRMAG